MVSKSVQLSLSGISEASGHPRDNDKHNFHESSGGGASVSRIGGKWGGNNLGDFLLLYLWGFMRVYIIPKWLIKVPGPIPGPVDLPINILQTIQENYGNILATYIIFHI